ncbi:hypothetical protein ABZ726_23500 [Streptomyces hundungensis]|uniref:hypothetical protein n=1 Tax=Streptomyces hundungensis TaxID=1077946 RepID=UPI0033DFAA10
MPCTGNVPLTLFALISGIFLLCGFLVYVLSAEPRGPVLPVIAPVAFALCSGSVLVGGAVAHATGLGSVVQLGHLGLIMVAIGAFAFWRGLRRVGFASLFWCTRVEVPFPYRANAPRDATERSLCATFLGIHSAAFVVGALGGISLGMGL